MAWYWAFSWPPGAPKGPVLAQNASFGGPGGLWRARSGHIWPQPLGLLCLGWTHGYHRLSPGIEPLCGPVWSKKATFGAKMGAFGAPDRQEEAPYHESKLGTAVCGSWEQIWLPRALSVPPRASKGAFWAKASLFWGPRRGPTPSKSVWYIMISTHADQSAAIRIKSGPQQGPSESIPDPQMRHLGPKRALLGPLGAKKRPNARSKCVVTMTPTQSDHFAAIGTKSGPKCGPQSFSPS